MQSWGLRDRVIPSLTGRWLAVQLLAQRALRLFLQTGKGCVLFENFPFSQIKSHLMQTFATFWRAPRACSHFCSKAIFISCVTAAMTSLSLRFCWWSYEENRALKWSRIVHSLHPGNPSHLTQLYGEKHTEKHNRTAERHWNEWKFQSSSEGSQGCRTAFVRCARWQETNSVLYVIVTFDQNLKRLRNLIWNDAIHSIFWSPAEFQNV